MVQKGREGEEQEEEEEEEEEEEQEEEERRRRRWCWWWWCSGGRRGGALWLRHADPLGVTPRSLPSLRMPDPRETRCFLRIWPPREGSGRGKHPLVK